MDSRGAITWMLIFSPGMILCCKRHWECRPREVPKEDLDSRKSRQLKPLGLRKLHPELKIGNIWADHLVK
jgi:hypothetical protein